MCCHNDETDVPAKESITALRHCVDRRAGLRALDSSVFAVLGFESVTEFVHPVAHGNMTSWCLMLVCNSKLRVNAVHLHNYGLDGPGMEFRWGRDFLYPSIPPLGPTHAPVQ